MVAAISSSANVIPLFAPRATAPADCAECNDKPFEQDTEVDAKGKASPGGPPRDLLSFEGAATLQESENPNGEPLSEQEQAELRDLKSRDAEVRQHERAHASTGGRYAGSPSYEYQRGPDGKTYAIGGEVPIDVSPIAGNPQATIDKMEQVKAAASAPAQPSSQDRQVAAQAEAERQKAVRELSQQKTEDAKAAQNGEDGGFQAFTAADFRRVGPAPASTEPQSPRPTRPTQPSVLDIVV